MNETTTKLIEREKATLEREIATLTGVAERHAAELADMNQRIKSLKARVADLNATLNGTN